MSTLNWEYKHFTALTHKELYAILDLRNKVFVVEQNCVYNDTDGKDLNCWHLCGWQNNVLVAYARIIAPGISYEEASIGRVITHPDFRKLGYGKELMTIAIEKTNAQFNVNTIKIGGQLYLEKFYNNLGFQTCSEAYLEDGIPHVEMVYGNGR
jgi:ElaA protein